MASFSELLQGFAQTERHAAEHQARITRQVERVGEPDAEDHDTTFSAKRLLVMGANLNQMERRRQKIVRELLVAQREQAKSAH
jgi:hypothetical protein